MTAPQCFGFIPARYASTRFPGKPLVDILGKPMFWHVWERASRCPLLQLVTLCTDDRRIAASAKALGVPYVMTREDHASGTDRIYEAAKTLNLAPEAVVVNIRVTSLPLPRPCWKHCWNPSATLQCAAPPLLPPWMRRKQPPLTA